MELKQPTRIELTEESPGDWSVMTYRNGNNLHRWDFRTEAEARDHAESLGDLFGLPVSPGVSSVCSAFDAVKQKQDHLDALRAVLDDD